MVETGSIKVGLFIDYSQIEGGTHTSIPSWILRDIWKDGYTHLVSLDNADMFVMCKPEDVDKLQYGSDFCIYSRVVCDMEEYWLEPYMEGLSEEEYKDMYCSSPLYRIDTKYLFI